MPEPVGAASIRAEQVHYWSAELMCQGTAGLFLYGIAGIGKSVLAGEIADQIIAEHPGTRATTVTGVLTVEQLVSIMVAEGPSVVVLDQFDTNVADGAIADRGLAAVLVCLAEEITGRENQRGHTRLIVVAREPLALGPRILVRRVGPLSWHSADEFARSLPRLKTLTAAERDYAWRLTAGHPGCLRAFDARLADATFAGLSDSLAGEIAARTGLQAATVFPAELDPAAAEAVAAAAGSVLNTPHDQPGSPLKAVTSDPPKAGPPGTAPADAPATRTRTDTTAPAGHEPLRPVTSDAPHPPPKAGRRIRVLSAAVVTTVIVVTPFAIRSLTGGTASVAVAVRTSLSAGLGGPTAAQPQAAQPEAAEPQAAQPQAAEPQAAQSQAPQAAAATWLASNVTPGTLIGCDPAMCASLSRQGLDQLELSPLRPGSDVTADGLIVATPQARALMGSAILAAAPELAASFGAGSGRVDIREVISGGAAAYNSGRLAADLASRREAGNLMLGNPDVKAAGTTWMTLAAGQVDERIVLALAQMAHSAPLTIQAFGAANPGAATEVPVRSVLIDVANPAAAADALEVQDPAMQPLSVRTGHGTLWVEYGAPSPLGLFQAES